MNPYEYLMGGFVKLLYEIEGPSGTVWTAGVGAKKYIPPNKTIKYEINWWRMWYIFCLILYTNHTYGPYFSISNDNYLNPILSILKLLESSDLQMAEAHIILVTIGIHFHDGKADLLTFVRLTIFHIDYFHQKIIFFA